MRPVRVPPPRGVHDGQPPPRRTARRARRPGRPLAPRDGVLHGAPGPGGRRPAGGVRHLRAPRLVAEDRVQRGPHRRDHPGDLRVPRGAGHRRAAVPRPRHPRAVRAGRPISALEVLAANGVTRAGRQPRRLHADARAVARDPRRYNRGRTSRPGRRHRRHAVAQPARATAASSTTRPTAARPTPTPPAGSRTAPTSCSRDGLDGVAADPVRAGAAPPTPRGATTSSTPTSTTCRTSSTSTRSATPGVRIGADPLGGASVAYWGAIAERYGLDLTVVNPLVDPHVPVHDAGLGRQDPDGLLVAVRDGLADRKRATSSTSPPATTPTPTGTASSRPTAGLMNPNHYLAVAIDYLFAHRPGWPADAAIGKTLVSLVDDRPGRRRARPAGWSRCRSASSGSCPACSTARSASAARSRAGASFLRTRRHGLDHRQGRHPARPARLGDPGGHRQVAERSTTRELTAQFGDPAYARVDAPATREQKAALAQAVARRRSPPTPLAGEPITAKLTEAPGNGAAIGGLKVTTESRLVRRPPVRHRGRLQDLRRVLPGRRPPGAAPGGGPRGGVPGARRLTATVGCGTSTSTTDTPPGWSGRDRVTRRAAPAVRWDPRARRSRGVSRSAWTKTTSKGW